MDLHRTPGLASVFALVTLLVSTGCKAYPPGTPLPDVVDEINATLQPNLTILQPGDGISIKFLHTPGNNQTVTIGPDGRASFYLLDEIEVAGMTLEELDDELTLRYEESLISPDLTVSLGQTGPRQVLILGGEGRTVGITPHLTIPMLELFVRANIPRDPLVMLQHMVLMRYMPEEGRKRVWVIDAREDYWYHPVDLMFQNGDIIYIPDQPLQTASSWMRQFMRILPLPRFLIRQS